MRFPRKATGPSEGVQGRMARIRKGLCLGLRSRRKQRGGTRQGRALGPAHTYAGPTLAFGDGAAPSRHIPEEAEQRLPLANTVPSRDTPTQERARSGPLGGQPTPSPGQNTQR